MTRRRESFTELSARERSIRLLDQDTARELLGPFDRMESPWLQSQGITPQADDGCIVIKGSFNGKPGVVIALEGSFQGGSLGEVSGAKMCAALDLAREDCERGIMTHAVLLLETGGVRLQEANLGLAAVAEIMSSIIALREFVPVTCVIAGPVGCFGGMSLAAALCSNIVMTRGARLGMNGPEVIEQESGIDEFDASDRALTWSIHGGEQRVAMGLADVLVNDDAAEIASTVRNLLSQGHPAVQRTTAINTYSQLIANLDPSTQWDPISLRQPWHDARAAAYEETA